MFNTDLIEEYFPLEKFRPGQKECIEAILNAYNKGKKFVILEAPTGSGKSVIGMTIAKFFKNSYYLTIQKILQDQLAKDFSDETTKVLKGRNAYPCDYWGKWTEKHKNNPGMLGIMRKAAKDPILGKTINNPKLNCSTGVCLVKEGKGKCVPCFPSGYENIEKSTCPYWKALWASMQSKTCIMNFHSFLYQTQVSGRFSQRDLLIIDEAHQSEPQLMDFVCLSLTDRKFQKQGITFPKFDTAEEYATFFEENMLAEKIQDIVRIASYTRNFREADEWKKILTQYGMFIQSVSSGDWIPKWEDMRGYHKITLKPIFVDKHANKHLFSFGDKILMMSATILMPKVIYNSLGIDPSDAFAYRMKNRFPPENRPIYFQPSGSMSYKNKKLTLPTLLKDIEAICNNFKGKKGIIHTHNFEICEYILLNCSDNLKHRVLYQRNFDNKDAMLKEHAKRENGIIIAPAMHEGLDLKGDLCYDQETDILTEFGWVEFPKLIDGIKVATYHPHSQEISFEIPKLIIKERSSKWVEFNTMTNNLMVTQNHRMLWRNSSTKNLKETTAGNAPTSRHHQFISGGYLNSPGLNLTDNQIRLCVAYQADGSWVEDNVTEVRFGFRRPRKIKRLRSLLADMEISFRELQTKRGDVKLLVPKKYFVILRILGDWDTDKIWKYESLLKLNVHQREVLLSELPHWDGTEKSLGKNSHVYASSIPENIDTIQALAALTGHYSFYNGHRLTWKDTQFTTFVNGEFNYIKKEYDTTLPCYCVAVNSGWIVTRRRGKVTISGNSRFQIICKVPYPSFQENEQLKLRMQMSDDYYGWLTALKLIQSYGRSIRSMNDWADTFILDADFESFQRRNHKILPKWFKQAVQ